MPSVSWRIVPVKKPDQPAATADAAMAYSSTSAQTTAQHRNTPQAPARTPPATRRCRDGIFKHQRPTDGPSKKLAHSGVAVGVCRACDWDHCGYLRVAQGCHYAHAASNHESKHQPWPRLLRAGRSQNENTRPDDAANAKEH